MALPVEGMSCTALRGRSDFATEDSGCEWVPPEVGEENAGVVDVVVHLWQACIKVLGESMAAVEPYLSTSLVPTTGWFSMKLSRDSKLLYTV